MDLIIQEHCKGIRWEDIREALKEAGMGYHTPDEHRKAFENSYAVIFVLCSGRLIGFGRALSDGAYQASIYDIVVIPAHQGQGIGRLILDSLLAKNPPLQRYPLCQSRQGGLLWEMGIPRHEDRHGEISQRPKDGRKGNYYLRLIHKLQEHRAIC